MTRQAFCFLVFAAAALDAEKFYPDDPVRAFPAPQNVEGIRPRRINEYYDFFQNLMFQPGEIPARTGVAKPARGVNTLGEVMDSEWYTNRHGRTRMTLDELQRGPGNEQPPSMSKPWRVTSAKSEGVTPGFTIVDGSGRRYLLKFDPPAHAELASAADVISSKFLYALGYNVPENYIVRFRPEQLGLDSESAFVDHYGKRRALTPRDLEGILAKVKAGPDGYIRALASRFIPGSPVGAFRYHGTRSDDPNDTIPHEHRRELRGLRVFAAWLDHDDSRSINTLDTLVDDAGRKYIKHYLIDFGSTLGSATYGPNSPRSGNEYVFEWGAASRQFVSMGFWVPKWAKAKYPDIASAGKFEYSVFDPERWVPEYPNPAFTNMTADDAFWAAKQVMSFSDEDIRAIVSTGEYSDVEAEQWVIQCLIERRNRIGQAFLSRVLPLDRFRENNGRLEFDDLWSRHFGQPSMVAVQWYTFDNQSGAVRGIEGANTLAIPNHEGSYLAAELQANGKSLTVYVRDGREIVGLDTGASQPILLTKR
jgi:hypothetical protein